MTARPALQSHLDAQRFEDLIQVTDIGDAFYAIGKSYDALRKNLVRAGRLDLVVRLAEWKQQDRQRVREATGRSWG